MHSIIVRRARATDAVSVAALISRSFRPEDLALTIYGCRGIAEYLRRSFDAQENTSQIQYLVAYHEGAVAGFLELRSTESGLILNYIATDERVQGRGLATLLLKQSLQERNAPKGTRLSLDIFGHNSRAKSWYTRLGFERTGSVGFWRARVDSTFQGAGRFRILDLPKSDADHEVFGFSILTLAHSGQTFTVGRMGSAWFRISDPRLLSKPEILGGLVLLENERKLLVNVRQGDIHAGLPLELELLLQSDRMQANLPLSL